jgi:hypothetical protein
LVIPQKFQQRIFTANRASEGALLRLNISHLIFLFGVLGLRDQEAHRSHAKNKFAPREKAKPAEIS